MPGISVSKICVPFGGGGIDWSSYWTQQGVAELIAYNAGLSTPLSVEQNARLETFIKAIKTGLSITNLSDAFDVMYVLAGETSESSLRNLVKNAHHGTAVNAPAWAQFEGYTGALTKYINTNYNPNTQASVFSLNSASLGLYSRINSTTPSDMVEIGARDAANGIFLSLRYLSDYRGTNTAVVDSFFQPNNTLGFHCSTRNNATSEILYKSNNVNLSTNANSTSIVNYNIYLLGLNYAGTLKASSTRQISFAFIGKGFSEANATVISNAIEAYMDANGKGVL